MKRFISLLFLGGLLFGLFQPVAVSALIPGDCSLGDPRPACAETSPFQRLSMIEQAKVYTELNFMRDSGCRANFMRPPSGNNLYERGNDPVAGDALKPFGLHEETSTGGQDGLRSCSTATFGSLLSVLGYSSTNEAMTKACQNKANQCRNMSDSEVHGHIYNHLRATIYGCGNNCTDNLVESQRPSAYYTALMTAFKHARGCNAGALGENSKKIFEIDEASGKAVGKDYKYQNETVNVGYGIASDGVLQCSTIADILGRDNGAVANAAIRWQSILDRATGVDNLRQGAAAINGSTGTNDEILCNVGALGFLICPATQFLANLTDLAYEGIERLLVYDPIGFDTKSPLYIAWSNARNLANLCFILAIFVIIYSQITGVGISNYGIKKLLPQIVVSAIFVNTSYFICVFLIDLSNIFGANIDDWIQQGARAGIGGGSQTSTWGSIISTILAGGGLAGIALVPGGAGWLAGVAFSLLIATGLAIAMTLLILLTIKAIVPLWIVFSAIAGVARLLQGTNRFWDIWQNVGGVILLLYPLISLIYATGGLAGDIIRASGGGS